LHIVSNNWSGLDNALAKTETKTTESWMQSLYSFVWNLFTLSC
jgi:hypothetical protein